MAKCKYGHSHGSIAAAGACGADGDDPGIDPNEPCRCLKPAPVVPGALCRRCRRWTVALVDAKTGELRTIPSNQ